MSVNWLTSIGPFVVIQNFFQFFGELFHTSSTFDQIGPGTRRNPTLGTCSGGCTKRLYLKLISFIENDDEIDKISEASEPRRDTAPWIHCGICEEKRGGHVDALANNFLIDLGRVIVARNTGEGLCYEDIEICGCNFQSMFRVLDCGRFLGQFD